MEFVLTKKSFIDGALREKGYRVTELPEGVRPGSNLRPADAEAEALVAEWAAKDAAKGGNVGGGTLTARAGAIASELEAQLNAMRAENDALASELSGAQVERDGLLVKVSDLEAELERTKAALASASAPAETGSPAPAGAGGPKPAPKVGGAGKAGTAG